MVKQEKNTVVPLPEHDVASVMEAMAKELGTGLEQVTAKDQVISRMTILQPLSPQLQTNSEAKAGQICDTGLGTIFPGSLNLLPVHFAKQWLQWGPRGSGRGLVRIHDTDHILEQAQENDRRQFVLPNKDYVVETSQLFVINLSSRMEKGFIAFQSTQLKKIRQLLTNVSNERAVDKNGREYTPPLFYRVYTFSTQPESNAQGNWWGWRIESGAKVEELENWQSLLVEVKNFRTALTAGSLKADMSSIAEEAHSGGRGVIDQDDDKEVPF
jgi:hypothetical protein